MPWSEALYQLNLFREKTAELDEGVLFQKKQQIGSLVVFDREQGWDGVFVGPGEGAIREAVLTLRLFMQNKDSISLQNMRTLMGGLPIEPEVLERFNAQCDALNRYLDSETNLAIEDSKTLTCRDILVTFVYGAYAHAEPKHRLTYEGIRQTPFFPMFQVQLSDVLLNFRRCLLVLNDVAGQAIDQLRATPAV